MQNELNREFIRALAQANGLVFPEERLEIVLRQYRNFLASLARLDSLKLDMAAEPDLVFSLVSAADGASSQAAPRKAR
ncbi:MAG TPA: hypothetical protein VGJ87_00865 [Roseiflexaceae bacterium]|jgi:hypothetical protein